MVIYKTTNLLNNKIYIGKDKRNRNSYLGSGIILKQSIEKHGIENFKKEILEYCTSENIDEREIYWIEFYNSRDRQIGYNIADGGQGGNTYKNLPNEQLISIKRKISEKGKGRISSQKSIKQRKETRIKKYGFEGFKHSEESKKIISQKNKGRLTGIKRKEEDIEKWLKTKVENEWFEICPIKTTDLKNNEVLYFRNKKQLKVFLLNFTESNNISNKVNKCLDNRCKKYLNKKIEFYHGEIEEENFVSVQRKGL